MPLPDAVFLGHMLGAIDRLSELLARTDRDLFDKLTHDYFVVDLGIVWSTATVNIPEVDPLLRAAAATLRGADLPDQGAR